MGLFEQYPLVFAVAVAVIGGASGWASSWFREWRRSRNVNAYGTGKRV